MVITTSVLFELLIPLMLVAGITLWIIRRRQRHYKLKLDLRKVGVFLAQFVMRLELVAPDTDDKFRQRYGFETCYRTRDQTPIYELDLSRPGILNDRARVFFRCLKNAL